MTCRPCAERRRKLLEALKQANAKEAIKQATEGVKEIVKGHDRDAD